MQRDHLEFFPRESSPDRSGSAEQLDALFARLATSRFRSRFKLATRERDYLRLNGLETVRSHARAFIDQRLAAAEPVNDGKQTPFRGHPVFVAQHATATCCRTCLSKWHGIAKGRELTREERDHAVAAIERWLLSQAEPT